MKTPPYFVSVILLMVALLGVAEARIEFGLNDFAVSEFRGFEKIQATCSTPAASFFCGGLDDTLTRIPTKGADFFFNPAGELVAVYAKQQKGQQLNSYAIDNRQNLIPFGSSVPGNALLVGGEYTPPEDVQGSWERLSDIALLGTFSYRVGDLAVDKRVTVSNTTLTMGVEVEVARAAGAEAGEVASGDDVLVQLAYPGLAGQASPVIKVGQGLGEAGTFSLNPLSQPVANPSYISLQGNNRNTGFAIVALPDEPAQEYIAQSFPPGLIALGRELPPGGGTTRLDLDVYNGPNELVRYDQEGYDDLPGLFRPNILGRLSLAIIWVLQAIHGFVGNWGLSIIVLTLLFRAVIWPLIATQTKSMYGMQELQPKIQALQKKYKDDREKLTQETMALYKEAGVNPAGGCLPILLQMPLFIILWRVFVNFEFNEGFLWIPDLGQPDPFFILPILYVAVMVGQSFFMARGNPQSLRQQLIINLVFVFIMLSFPAGVILYFVVSMGIQVLQYWLLNRNKPAPALAKSK